MKLFEVDSSYAGDTGGLLRILKGEADKKGGKVKLTWPAFYSYLNQFDLPLGGLRSDKGKMIAALKNLLPSLGAIIKTHDDTGIELDLNNQPGDQTAAQGGSGGPSVDAMASSNAKELKPQI